MSHSINKSPLISIIIATFNVEHLIERTLNSIITQTYKHFEIIIVDGNSTDGTLTIIEEYIPYIKHLISESDSGIYDAWNKGIKLSKGSWISFIGAGDIYLKDALENYIDHIRKLNYAPDFISSQIHIVDNNGKLLFKVGNRWEWPKFSHYMTAAHVGSLHSKLLFDKIGLFNSTYKIAGDYELLLRLKENLKTYYVSKVTAHMLYGGKSNSKKILKEIIRIKIETLGWPKIKAYREYYINSIKKTVREFLNSFGIFILIKEPKE